MTIYVDEPTRYETHLRYKVWAHMWSDVSDEELHAMADKLDLKREWFQAASPNATKRWTRYYNHYDITPNKRALAITCGAVAVKLRDYLKNSNPLRQQEPT